VLSGTLHVRKSYLPCTKKLPSLCEKVTFPVRKSYLPCMEKFPSLSGRALILRESFPPCILGDLPLYAKSFPPCIGELPHCPGESPSLYGRAPSLYRRVSLPVWGSYHTVQKSFSFRMGKLPHCPGEFPFLMGYLLTAFPFKTIRANTQRNDLIFTKFKNHICLVLQSL
jgi:hypothetical protein